MDSRKATTIRPVRKARGFPELEFIGRTDEQIRQINGIRSALKEVVAKCGERLGAALAVIILRDKGITVRFDKPAKALANAGKVVAELEQDLVDWLKDTTSGSTVNSLSTHSARDIRPCVPCKSIVAPIMIDDEQLEGILTLVNPAEADDFTRRDQELVQAIARNVSLMIDARFDRMTGLINRKEFEFELDQSMAPKRMDKGSHCILHINLDEMQRLADSIGYDACDEAIRQVAHLLDHEVSDTGPVARIGEDEFAILIDNCPADRGWVVGQEIRRAIKGLNIIYKRPIKLTASIGVATLGAEGDTVGSALAAAKIACIVAKDRGRDRVVRYRHNDALFLHGQEQMQGVDAIQRALRDDQFLLYCQVIKPLTSKDRSPHFEILLRGVGDHGNPFGPNEFLQHAEHSQLMPAIDRWVVSNSLNRLSGFRLQLAQTNALFAINLSGQSICDESFLDFVIGEIDRSGIPPKSLCFEITETTAILNMNRAMKFMTDLKLKGCRFSLDDFGSGLSSFSYLKTLPVDFLKIDGQFVREIAEDPVSNAMIAAINQLGHAMGLKTIAEYVEGSAVKTQLISLGVDYAQGFGISKPKPLQDELDRLSQLVRPLHQTGRRRDD